MGRSRPDRKPIRQQRATENMVARVNRTAAMQMMRLDVRLGDGVGAKRERTMLDTRLAVENRAGAHRAMAALREEMES